MSNDPSMSMHPPLSSHPLDEETVEELARLDRIVLEPGEAAELLPVIRVLTDFGDVVERLESYLQAPALPDRDPGYLPDASENPYNAFIRRCHVRTTENGPLAGKTVGLKDNIALAGVPTTNASRVTPVTPQRDAVVVERILAAGGTIVGKLNMDDFGGAGLGETSAFGPPRNPINPAHSAGGSSGGSGAAVRSGEVDLALGVDQGGSGRIPAAFCGVIAAKATHGLVPSQGITHIDHTIDFVTPLGRTVADVAVLLEVIAGPDDRDPQWVRGDFQTQPYSAAQRESAKGLSVAVVTESADPEICDAAVLEGLAAAGDAFARSGARVTSVSIPLWRDALSFFVPYIGHLVASTFRTEGQGTSHLGMIDVEAMRAFAYMRREESVNLAKQIKCWVIADRYIHEIAYGIPYGQLHQLRLALRTQIDEALERCDLLLTPTLPMTAPRLASPETPFSETSTRTVSRLPYNTAPLNLSGHPALSLPSGTDEEGLPTAVQIIARRFDEYTAFRAAFALEQILEA